MKGWATSMACPKCGVRRTQVLQTVRGPSGSVWRYRVCANGDRFKTSEQAVESTPRSGPPIWLEGAA